MRGPRRLADADCVPPHDLTGKPAVLPTGPAAARLIALMDASKPVVAAAAAEVGSIATQIWLWGQGTKPELPEFAARYGVEGRLSSAVDLVRGLGVLSGIEVLDVAGATAGFDNDYVAQRDACARCRCRIATCSSCTSRPPMKRATSRCDRREGHLARDGGTAEIIGPHRRAHPTVEPFRMLLLPDHATPCALRTHTSDPVPYLLFDSEHDGAGGIYTERGVAACVPEPAHQLMARLLA